METLRRGISASSEVAGDPNEGPKVDRKRLRYLPPEPPTRGRPAVSVKGPKGPIIYTAHFCIIIANAIYRI